MNLSPPLTLSIFRFVQALPQTPHSLTLSFTTCQNLVAGLIDLLIDEGIVAEFWIKSPRDSSWLGEIKRYEHEIGVVTKVYCCSDSTPLNSCIPIQLPKNNQLQKDFFFLVISPQFSAFILGQQDKISKNMQVLFSCQNSLTHTVLNAIKQAVSFPERAVYPRQTRKLVGSSQETYQAKFLTNLLLKQAQYQDQIAQAEIAKVRSQECQTALDNSLQFKDELLAQAVRELCNPLSTMKTALSLLESKRLKQAQRKHYTSMLKGQCERQGVLIDGLVELVGLERLTQNTDQPVTSVSDLVPGIVSTYQPLALEKGLRLGYTIANNLPLIRCPNNWLKQIIINLLDNCLKFTPSGGQISVLVSQMGANVQLAFTDTGSGIAQADLKKIFNSFYRCRKNDPNNHLGAGLGLTIVHQLLLRCGGSISVESKLEQGSTFKILLPTIKGVGG